MVIVMLGMKSTIPDRHSTGTILPHSTEQTRTIPGMFFGCLCDFLSVVTFFILLRAGIH
jgi:hypothetical protein